MSVLTPVLAAVIEWLLSQFETWAGVEYSDYKAQQQITQTAAADAAQLQSATTAGDKTNAAEQYNKDTFPPSP